MDQTESKKRPSYARESLEILRRIEPALVQTTAALQGLREGVADLVVNAVSGRLGGGGGGGPAGAVPGLAPEALTQLTEGVDQLAANQERLYAVLNRLRISQEEGQDRLASNHTDLLEGVELLREEVAGQVTDLGTTNETIASHLQRLRQAQARMVEEQALYLEGQTALASMLAQLEERLRRQAWDVKQIRRELRFLPVLWTLAVFVFAAVGAAAMVLRAHLN